MYQVDNIPESASLEKYTENGALSYNDFQGLLKAYYHSVRGIDRARLLDYMDQAMLASPVDAVVLAFHIRDARGGKGERQLGRWCFEWLARHHGPLFAQLMHFIPEYGRWDDFFSIDVHNATPFIIQYIANQFTKDKFASMRGDPISLLAKWLPSEGKSFARNHPEKFTLLLKTLGKKSKTYRKEVAVLREYLRIVETYMCSGRWEEIDFSRVPGVAMSNLRKAFKKHTPETYENWLENVKQGTSKIHTPDAYVIVEKYFQGGLRVRDDTLEEQWKRILDTVHVKDEVMCVCDTSGSMSGKPMAVALSLSILFAQKNKDNPYFITFSTDPQLWKVRRDATLVDCLRAGENAPWQMSTNFQQVFRLVLTLKKPPACIVVISDMQFDECQSGSTNFDEIKKMYARKEKTMPSLVFWNVNGKYTDSPVSAHSENVTVVSGFTPTLFKHIVEDCTHISPTTILQRILVSERYAPVRETVEKCLRLT